MAVIKKDIEHILEIAVHAPSGDNSQPWEFRIENDKFFVFNMPGKDATLYNYKERGSYISHGAVIENISIASSENGYKAEVDLFPDTENSNLIAAISVSKSNSSPGALYDSILKRATNRKPYEKRSLQDNHRKELLSLNSYRGGGEITLIEDREKINFLGKAISLNERLILENKHIHDFLFGTIRWTKEEERARAGLYIKTLELPLPAELMFKMFKSWPIVEALNKIKFYKFLQAQTSRLYASSGAIGLITIQGDADADFVEVGRLFERFWLKATELGLSIQPITALAYLQQRIMAGETEEISKLHAGLIKEAYGKISDCFNIGNKLIAMIFRIGYDGEPSAKSFKFPPRILT